MTKKILPRGIVMSCKIVRGFGYLKSTNNGGINKRKITMKKLNVVTSDFQVVRNLEINGERLKCEYFDRFQLHDIKEFVSIYRVYSTNKNFQGLFIFGHEKLVDDEDTLVEEFFFAPGAVYEYSDFVRTHFHFHDIVAEYYRTTYTKQTGLTDYDNLSMESDGDCEELVPVYNENSYADRMFYERSLEQ